MTKIDAHHRFARGLMSIQAERVELQRTAVHKAGHAVTTLALGGRLAMVMVDKGICAELSPEEPMAGLSFSFDPTKGRRRTAVLVAGMLAEQAFGHPASWSGQECSQDSVALRQLADRKGRGELSAVADAIEMAQPVVTKYKSVIATVARLLQVRGSLAGPEIEALMAAGGRA